MANWRQLLGRGSRPPTGSADVEGPEEPTGWLLGVVSLVAVSMSVFQIYTAIFGTLPSISQRAVHLGFAMVLAWLLFDPHRNARQPLLRWLKWVFIAVTVFNIGYLALFPTEILGRMSYFEPLSALQMFIGISLVLLLLEASRRAVGMIFTSLIVLLIVYGFVGPYLPGPLYHRGFSTMWIVDHLVFTTYSVFGMPSGVSATYVFTFLLFGAFLERTGAGAFLINLAISMTGRFRGGPAKVAVVGSAFFGMISGSAVANVVTTGSMTIPLMKKIGFSRSFAGAVEAVASSGGQFTPPLMGATAFLVAEFSGVPYIQVALVALAPAVLYYAAVIWQVHFRAVRQGLKGMSTEELPSSRRILLDGYYYFVPIALLLGMLLMGYTPMRAGLIATGALVAIGVIRRTDRLTVRRFFQGLESAARIAVPVAIILNAAGIVIGMFQLTGLGVRFSSIILDLGGGHTLLTLLLVMVTSIVLGMGLPTIGAYVIQVALTVPVLIHLDVSPLAAHLFVFYFATLSAITPPVAVAAYAAAGIAGANPSTTGFAALRLAIAGFIIPYMFVFYPALLLDGSPLEIVRAVVTGFIGVTFLASAVEGWCLVQNRKLESLLLLVAALGLIQPQMFTDFAGFALGGLVLLVQYLRYRRLADSAVA
ncbi:MAG: TRAP transporter permease [Aquisalimonadaceae bacterium]